MVWQGEVQTCQPSLKGDRIDQEVGHFQNTWNYGPENLNGGRAENRPLFLLFRIHPDDLIMLQLLAFPKGWYF